jgi:hypothetical protein
VLPTLSFLEGHVYYKKNFLLIRFTDVIGGRFVPPKNANCVN